jgi:hypothetical protein
VNDAEQRARDALRKWDQHDAMSPRLAMLLAEALRALLAQLDDERDDDEHAAR